MAEAFKENEPKGTIVNTYIYSFAFGGFGGKRFEVTTTKPLDPGQTTQFSSLSAMNDAMNKILSGAVQVVEVTTGKMVKRELSDLRKAIEEQERLVGRGNVPNIRFKKEA